MPVAQLPRIKFGSDHMERNDIYDKDRKLTGRTHRRGTPWRKGEYGLVVCVWVYNGKGEVLLTRRAPEKSFAGTWENSGGAAQVGENSLQAITRELREETGIVAVPEELKLLCSSQDKNAFYDFYCLKRDIPIEEIVLQPGETDGAQWADREKIHQMIRKGQICKVISEQYLRQEPMLREVGALL